MTVWVVKTGEPLPTDGDGARLNRSGLLAEMLVRRGHDVTWWTSDFDHARKQFRLNRRHEQVSEHFRIVQLHGISYSRNVSLRRIVNHRQVAGDFVTESASSARPDVIVCAYPTIDLALASVRYGRRQHVPVIVDVRDLWPDIFLDVAPRLAQQLARVALSGMYANKRAALAGASAVTGTSDAFVDWGVGAAGRTRGPLDKAFAHGYPRPGLTPEARQKAVEYWRGHFAGDFPRNLICFFGNFADHVLDLVTPIEAVTALVESGCDLDLVLCGTGPSLERMRAAAAGCPRIHFPGRVGQAEIQVMMENSRAGLLPYVPRWDFTVTVPNKAIEYLSAGLPVISCLSGESRTLLEEADCGLFYTPGDVADFTRQINHVLQDADRKDRPERAQRLFASRFDAETVYANYAAHVELTAASQTRQPQSATH